jgi:glycosyltransferase involved in cell wall biosynthesis
VIPTFNSEKFVEECILSIINQDYDNIEIIIVDGLSQDSTLQILNKYRKYISILISERDEGIYDAINKGIRNCKGDLIKILNSDDALTENSLLRALKVYNENIEKKDKEFIIMSTLERISLNGEKIATWGKFNNVLFFENLLHPSWYVPMQTYEKFGLYNLKYNIASDYEYFMRLKKSKVKLLKSKTPYTKYREGGTSSGLSGKYEVYEIKKIYKGVVMANLLLLQMRLFVLRSKIKNVLSFK